MTVLDTHSAPPQVWRRILPRVLRSQEKGNCVAVPDKDVPDVFEAGDLGTSPLPVGACAHALSHAHAHHLLLFSPPSCLFSCDAFASPGEAAFDSSFVRIYLLRCDYR